MALPFAPDAHALPMHVLFPEAYEDSKRMIKADFLVYGCMIVGAVVTLAYLYA